MTSSHPTSIAVVTGGAGFIGSHLVDALVDRGTRVVVVDDLSSGRRDRVHPAATFVEADVVDSDAMRRLARRVGPATWFHLAAQVDVRRSVAAPAEDCWTNVLGTVAVLEAARDSGSHVVFASTGGAIYGEDAPRPSNERAVAAPLSPYGAAKLAAEAYLGTYARLHGVPSTALRLANVYGPRQDAHGEAGVVAIFGGLLARGLPVTIYGDGSQTRDYVYVADVVAAMLAAAAHSAECGDGFRRYNIGTGTATSVEQLWATMQQVAGVQAQDVRAPRRTGELQDSLLDPTRARRELGVALATNLDAGLRTTLTSLGVPIPIPLSA